MGESIRIANREALSVNETAWQWLCEWLVCAGVCEVGMWVCGWASSSALTTQLVTALRRGVELLRRGRSCLSVLMDYKCYCLFGLTDQSQSTPSYTQCFSASVISVRVFRLQLQLKLVTFRFFS